MIIGNGLMARAFNVFDSDEDVLIFASGVSNSLEKKPHEFKREESLLISTIENHPSKLLVYFSTYSIYDESQKSSKYVEHKLRMEKCIKAKSSQFFIFRLPNVVGFGGNNHTIFNFLVEHIVQQVEFTVWKQATRNILDVDDLFKIVENIMTNFQSNRILNIANPVSFKVIDIVGQIEKLFNVTAKVKYIDRGGDVKIDLTETESVIKKYLDEEKQSIQYIDHLLYKYHYQLNQQSG